MPRADFGTGIAAMALFESFRGCTIVQLVVSLYGRAIKTSGGTVLWKGFQGLLRSTIASGEGQGHLDAEAGRRIAEDTWNLFQTPGVHPRPVRDSCTCRRKRHTALLLFRPTKTYHRNTWIHQKKPKNAPPWNRKSPWNQASLWGRKAKKRKHLTILLIGRTASAAPRNVTNLKADMRISK